MESEINNLMKYDDGISETLDRDRSLLDRISHMRYVHHIEAAASAAERRIREAREAERRAEIRRRIQEAREAARNTE